MPKAGVTYTLPRGGGAHAQQTSTGTADVKTMPQPAAATAVFLSVETTAARVTFNGSTPSASNGQVIPFGGMPLFIPLGPDVVVKHVSTAAANSILNALWIE